MKPGRGRLIRLLLWSVGAVGLALICLRADPGGTLAALLPSDNTHLGREVRFFATQRAAQLLAIEGWATTPQGDPSAELRALGPRLEHLGFQPLGGADPAAFAHLEQVLYQHLPDLLDPAVLAAQEAKLSGNGLRAHLAALRERVADPSDIFASTAAQGDLLGLAGSVLSPLRDQLGGAMTNHGVIVHRDGMHHLLLAEVAFPPDDGDHTIALMNALDVCVSEAASRGVRLEPIGSHRHFRDNLSGLNRDLLRSLPVGMVLIALVLWTLVRSPRALIALHIPAVLAALGAVAILVVCGQPVPLILLGFAAGFLGVSVENALHMTVALQDGHQRAVRHPLLVGYLTTAVAFAVLLASDISGLRSLGIMVMGGLILALLSSLFLLPDLVERRRGVPTWALARRWLGRIAAMAAWKRLLILGVISAVCLPGLARVHIISDLRSLDGSRPETLAALTAFMTRWDHFETSDFLVVTASDIAAAQEAFAAAQRTIGGEHTVIDALLPAPSVQRERRAAWNAFWQVHAQPFATGLQDHLGPRGFAATALCRERYQPRAADLALVDDSTWADTPLRTVVDQLVQRSDRNVRLAAPLPARLQSADIDALKNLLPSGAAAPAAAEAWIASRHDLATDLVDLVRHDLTRLALWMAVAMALLVWLLERNLRAVMAILIPPALALGWCFGVLGWLNIPLSPFSVMIGAFVAGIGLDNAVFLARAQQRDHAFAPVLACTITTMLGVGSLILAQNPMLSQIGIALSLGLACCMIACVLLTPMLMDGRGER